MLTLCDPMDCSPPGSSVHGILQARILEWRILEPFPSPGDLPDPGSRPFRRESHELWFSTCFSEQAAVAPGDLVGMQGLGFHLDLLTRNSGLGETVICTDQVLQVTLMHSVWKPPT